jgi:hypothetical protein
MIAACRGRVGQSLVDVVRSKVRKLHDDSSADMPSASMAMTVATGIRDVCYHDEACSPEDRLFQIAAFRTFSKTATWRSVHDYLGRYPTRRAGLRQAGRTRAGTPILTADTR